MDYDFSDIRPYCDDEVVPVLARLLEDDEFLQTIRVIRMKWVPDWLYPLGKKLLVRGLKKRFQKIKNVHDFQLNIERYMNRCMLDTSAELEVNLEQPLDSKSNYLFMSNHRDIAMDPAICSVICHQAGMKTNRIAIGDNLLSKPFVSDLMRLNKSFIVKRSVESRREKFSELKKLSAYMRQSISHEHESVWIAQREGRAKDGIDKTDSALIKMLLLSKQKEQNIQEGLAELHIIPVSISYEWDPCDIAKARELAVKARDGVYEKDEHEDIASIAAGIQGWKGRVHIQYGEEIKSGFESAEEFAQLVDQQVIKGYKLQPSNIVAYQQLEGVLPRINSPWVKSELVEARMELALRLEKLTDDLDAQSKLLQGYANPVYQKLKLEASD